MALKPFSGAIFIILHLPEKYLENKKKCHVFVDLEKAFDMVPGPAMRWMRFAWQEVTESLIDLVMALYSERRSMVRVAEVTSFQTSLRKAQHCRSVSKESLTLLLCRQEQLSIAALSVGKALEGVSLAGQLTTQ